MFEVWRIKVFTQVGEGFFGINEMRKQGRAISQGIFSSLIEEGT